MIHVGIDLSSIQRGMLQNAASAIYQVTKKGSYLEVTYFRGY